MADMHRSLLGRIIFAALCSLVMLAIIAYGAVHSPMIVIFYLTISLLAIVWAADCFFSGGIRFSRNLIQVPLAGAAIYALVQAVPFGSIAEIAGVSQIPRTISMSPNDSVTTGLHLISLCIFFGLILVYIDRVKRIERLVNTLLIFGFAYAFFAIIQSFLSPTRIFGIYESASPFGSFVNRHNFAAVAEMLIAMPLGLLMTGAVRRDKKLLYITSIVLVGIALLLSGSRGGLIAIIAAVLLQIVITTRSGAKRGHLIKISASIVLAVAIIVGAILIGGESSLSRFAETAKAGDISTNRTEIWSVTLKVIIANFPFGAGIGAFGQAYSPFDPFNGLARVEQAHNDYLQSAADAGLVGILLLGGFLFLYIRQTKMNLSGSNVFRRGVTIGAAGSIFAILVHSLFDFVLHTTAISLLFITMLGLLVSSGREFSDEISEFDQSKPSRRRKRAEVKLFK